MQDTSNYCFIENKARNECYPREAVERVAPKLYRKLIEHEANCKISELPRPFQVNKQHIVYCPLCVQRLASLRDFMPDSVNDANDEIIRTVGVIGFGNFGAFFAKNLAVWFDVTAWDAINLSTKAESLGVCWGTLAQAARSDLVILAVTLDALEGILRELGSCLNSGALVMDVCSVKEEPIRLMKKYLSNEVELLGTHPLFGPQSARDGMQGHRIIICPITPRSPKVDYLLDFFQQRCLNITEMSAKEHDREMAVVQGLTHFIARALAECGIQSSECTTQAFDHLYTVMALLGNDSWEVFKTIQVGNAFAPDIRHQFVTKLVSLEIRLAQGQS